MQEIASEIVQQCQAGQTAVFSTIVQHYERALLAYVVRLNCTPGGRTSEDVVQEIFLKAYTSLARFRPHKNSSFTAWLFTIARNHCMSLGRRKRLEGRYLESNTSPASPPPSHTAASPALQAQQQETLQRVQEAVASLTEPMRSTFLLRYYQELSFAEVAEVLGCNEQTARTRVTRAKAALRQVLLNPSDTPESPPARSDHHASAKPQL